MMKSFEQVIETAQLLILHKLEQGVLLVKI